jgi:hypothetical protein
MAWAPDYVTDEDLREYLRVDDLDDDAQAGLAITAASRAIDDHANRQFGLVDPAVAARYTARYDYERCRWVADVDDYQTVVDLTVWIGDPAQQVTTFVKEPQNAALKGRPWTRISFTADSEFTPTGAVDEVGIVAKWGWTAVLDTVKQATLLQASRFLKRRDAPFGVAGSPELGSEMRLLAKVDPDVAVALRGLVRTRAVG